MLDPSDKNKGVRLAETQGNMKGTYACLSYCWGYWNNQTGRTTRDNLSSYRTGIPLNELPDTVIDAIHLCYKLGFRFLWVDRLCIVQDDGKDWLQEASKMCEIYSRSALTMTVPICHESSESFLAERKKGFQEQDMFSAITYLDKDSNSNVSQCIGWGSKGLWFLENSWGSFPIVGQILQNFWLERGWTLQEWLLSPRVLHIDRMTLWDCFDGYANELNMRRMDKALIVRNPKEFGASISWESILKEYSERELTREEDRLPALAGLAARYAQATGYTYLAGLWLEDLPRSLLWMMPTLYYHDPQERTSQSTPSWTWASLKRSSCKFLFPTAEDFTPTASIDSVFCRYNPPDSFAAIEKGWIDIDGHVSVVTCRMDDERSLLFNAGDESWEFIQDETKVDMVREIAQANVYLLLLGKGQGTLQDLRYVHMYKLYLEEASIDKHLGKPLYGALILQGSGCDDGRQCFRRMGIAYTSSEKEESRPAEFGPSWKRQTVRLV